MGSNTMRWIIDVNPIVAVAGEEEEEEDQDTILPTMKVHSFKTRNFGGSLVVLKSFSKRRCGDLE